MNLVKTTPVPNVVFDQLMCNLSMGELKVLLVIIRKTLGWKGTGNERKRRDWISTSQLMQVAGISRRVISGAISSLVQKKIIRITNSAGNELNCATERKGQIRLYFELDGIITGENKLKTFDSKGKNQDASAINAQDISKKVNALAHKLLITKETLQN